MERTELYAPFEALLRFFSAATTSEAERIYSDTPSLQYSIEYIDQLYSTRQLRSALWALGVPTVRFITSDRMKGVSLAAFLDCAETHGAHLRKDAMAELVAALQNVATRSLESFVARRRGQPSLLDHAANMLKSRGSSTDQQQRVYREQVLDIYTVDDGFRMLEKYENDTAAQAVALDYIAMWKPDVARAMLRTGPVPCVARCIGEKHYYVTDVLAGLLIEGDKDVWRMYTPILDVDVPAVHMYSPRDRFSVYGAPKYSEREAELLPRYKEHMYGTRYGIDDDGCLVDHRGMALSDWRQPLTLKGIPIDAVMQAYGYDFPHVTGLMGDYPTPSRLIEKLRPIILYLGRNFDKVRQHHTLVAIDYTEETVEPVIPCPSTDDSADQSVPCAKRPRLQL